MRSDDGRRCTASQAHRRRRLFGAGAEPVLSHGQGAGLRDPSKFDFQNRPTAPSWAVHGPLNEAGAAERDAIAYIAFLDAQKQVDRNKKVGTQGYCMGGPLIMKTAAAVPNRVGAAAPSTAAASSRPSPTSPHLLIPKMKARLYIGIAANDDMRQPDAKDTLKRRSPTQGAGRNRGLPDAQHGWCVPDMPLQANGMPIYNKEAAERAWGKLWRCTKRRSCKCRAGPPSPRLRRDRPHRTEASVAASCRRHETFHRAYRDHPRDCIRGARGAIRARRSSRFTATPGSICTTT